MICARSLLRRTGRLNQIHWSPIRRDALDSRIVTVAFSEAAVPCDLFDSAFMHKCNLHSGRHQCSGQAALPCSTAIASRLLCILVQGYGFKLSPFGYVVLHFIVLVNHFCIPLKPYPLDHLHLGLYRRNFFDSVAVRLCNLALPLTTYALWFPLLRDLHNLWRFPSRIELSPWDLFFVYCFWGLSGSMDCWVIAVGGA